MTPIESTHAEEILESKASSIMNDNLNSLVEQEKTAPGAGAAGDIIAPLSLGDMKKGEDLKTEKTDQKHVTPLIPVPEDAPPFDENTPEYFSKEFGYSPSSFYPYHTTEGSLFGYIVRWDIPQEMGVTQKETRPYLFVQDKNGQKRWRSKGFPEPRPLYNLAELTRRPDVPVLVCEGEKTAEAAKILFPHYVVTTSSHGSESAHKTDWSPLRGRNVIISPDFDEAGQGYAEIVTQLCRKAGAKITRYCFPEMFHILRIPYFEQKSRYKDEMVPRVQIESCFDGESSEAEAPEETLEQETEAEQAAKFKSEYETPLTIEKITKNASEDAALVLAEGGFLTVADFMEMPYDPSKIVPKGYDLADAKEEGWTAESIQAVNDFLLAASCEVSKQR